MTNPTSGSIKLSIPDSLTRIIKCYEDLVTCKAADVAVMQHQWASVVKPVKVKIKDALVSAAVVNCHFISVELRLIIKFDKLFRDYHVGVL